MKKVQSINITLKILPKLRKVFTFLDDHQIKKEFDNNVKQLRLHIKEENSESGICKESEKTKL